MKLKRSQIVDVRNILIIVGAISLISLFFPSEKKPKYRFEIGSQWDYEDLYAPFDFPILKSKEELEREQKKIEEGREWVFKRERDKERKSLKLLKQELDHLSETSYSIDSVERDYARSFVLNEVLDLYNRGVLEWPDTQMVPPKVIRLLDTSSTKVIPIDRFYSLKEAEKQLRFVLQQRVPNQAQEYLIPSLKYLMPNIVYDSDASESFLADRLAEISAVSGKVRNHEKIIGKGDLVTKDKYNKLASYQKYFKEKVKEDSGVWSRFAGYFILTCLIFIILALYLFYNFPQVYSNWKHVLFVLLWFVVFGYLVYTVERIPELNTYIIPFCIVPIVIKNFFDTRLSIFVHVLLILMVSYLTSFGYEFTFIQVLVGIVAILSTSETRQWSEFFKSILLIFLTGIISYFALLMITGVSIQEVHWEFVLWFLLNAMFILMAYPLIPLLERVFGFTSSITLVELSDMNHPLLKDLSLKAPGTLQHSLQVGNISEAAAKSIGANALLVKVGALYHDIGKMLSPEYFIENQKGENPHDTLTPKESAQKIIEHVTEGAKMARKAKLPKILIDFILTHHGNTRVEYFYQKALSEGEKVVNEKEFRYPGPKPVSKEQTILMLVDSVEAASKSLNKPDDSTVDHLVDSIVSSKIAQGQLEDSHLSFEELKTIVEVIKSLLKSIYHVRIKYPGQK